MIPTRLACHPGGTLEVGDLTVFNYRVTVEAHRSIRIGRRCMLGSSVRLCDAGPERVAPIAIGEDVWLAHGVIVEPGVTVGDRSVVSAGSVVKRDVPAHSLAAGNPARSVSLALAPGARQGA
jgi:maltose O-acetyltransferase